MLKLISKKYLALITLVLTVTIYFCASNSIDDPMGENIDFQKEGELIFLPTADHDSLVIDIELAENNEEMMQGLMYRKEMNWKAGMLFIYEDIRPMSFWMKNTHISLDLIFISEEGQILDKYEYAEPYSEENIFSEEYSKYTLEVNAGFCDKYNIKIGDRISWKRL